MSIPALLKHNTEAPSAFTAAGLMASVRDLRRLRDFRPPRICFLEFDGDLTDWLVSRGLARKVTGWPCFHTSMYSVSCEGMEIGIIDRTIGGPYAVLIAEQLHASGVELIVGLTSAGRISSELPLPCVVVASSAVRDEGTSFHYLQPGDTVECPAEITACLHQELRSTRWAVRTGRVWTTDAPYRESEAAINHWRSEGVLAVEMQAASLFAFGIARNAPVAVVARVSNAVDHQGDQFDTGSEEDGWQMLHAITRAGTAYLSERSARAPEVRNDGSVNCVA
jgi:uridine phosphorylase